MKRKQNNPRNSALVIAPRAIAQVEGNRDLGGGGGKRMGGCAYLTTCAFFAHHSFSVDLSEDKGYEPLLCVPRKILQWEEFGSNWNTGRCLFIWQTLFPYGKVTIRFISYSKKHLWKHLREQCACVKWQYEAFRMCVWNWELFISKRRTLAKDMVTTTLNQQDIMWFGIW